MNKFYCVIREGARQASAGVFEDIEEAKNAAKKYSGKSIKKERYIVLESVWHVKASVDFTCGECNIEDEAPQDDQ